MITKTSTETGAVYVVENVLWTFDADSAPWAVAADWVSLNGADVAVPGTEEGRNTFSIQSDEGMDASLYRDENHQRVEIRT